MTEWFSSQFIPGFCQVLFLCHDGSPNWLGWGLLGWGGLFAVGGVLGVFVTLMDR
jgi:hypothetical protein